MSILSSILLINFIIRVYLGYVKTTLKWGLSDDTGIIATNTYCIGSKNARKLHGVAIQSSSNSMHSVKTVNYSLVQGTSTCSKHPAGT